MNELERRIYNLLDLYFRGAEKKDYNDGNFTKLSMDAVQEQVTLTTP